jgi:tetratricopeptide (TPR) repeat protein
MGHEFDDELQLLYNALNAEVFRFILISHNHTSIYHQVHKNLQEQFAQHRKIYEFSFAGKTPTDIRDMVLQLGKGILLLRDLEYLFREENNELCTYFNQRRDFFAKNPIAFVCFIEPSTFKQVLKKLPDWWSIRSLELELMEKNHRIDGVKMIWDSSYSSPYANWTQAQRDEEIARIERLIDQAEPENLNLLVRLYAQLGDLYFHSQDYQKASDYYQISLKNLDHFDGLEKLKGELLNNIAGIYRARGDYDTALRYLEQSLAIQQQIGDRSGEGTNLNNISQIYHAKGDYNTALRYLEQSLAIHQQIGDQSGEGTNLNNISQIYHAKGDYNTALRYLKQSLTIQQQIGDRLGEGTTLNNISRIYHTKGDYDTALRYLEQSLAIQQQIGDRSGEGTNLNNISQIYHAKGDYNTALRYLEQSLAIRQQIGDRSGLCATLHNMATIYLQQKEDPEEYLKLEVMAHQMAQEIGDVNAIYQIGWYLGNTLCQSDAIEQGLPILQNAYELGKKAGYPNVEEIGDLIRKYSQT